MSSTLNLRALVAMRREDLRIARKHRDEAEQRYVADPTESNRKAARGAQEWADHCLEALLRARAERDRLAEEALA